MATAPIVFDRVWKKFRRGERHDSLRDLVPAMTKRLMRRGVEPALLEKEFWALQDVSFEVHAGQALGIIGPNGAGKSTALKLLNRILKPSRGLCQVRGRAGALIEVGAGFHPDLTGRENIYLQGAIMGMKRAEIARQFDDIVGFAGIAEFIDTPVKRYSSGMNARLGFAIAAHLEPDVLLIDEVLSVGDMQFQQRCIERMQKFKRDGVAIAFVSHNLQAVASLCESTCYLRGAVLRIGPTNDVIPAYIRDAQANVAVASSEVEIVHAVLQDRFGRPVEAAAPGTPLTLRTTYRARGELRDWHIGFLAYRSTDGLLAYGRSVNAHELGLDRLTPNDEFTVDFDFVTHLTRGQYHFEVHMFHNPTFHHVVRLVPAATLRIDENATYSGIADLEFSCRPVHGEAPLVAVAGAGIGGRR